jgi:hypothetical protein
MEQTIPSNFKTVIADFTNDLSTTYSEYSYLWSKWNNAEVSEGELKELFDYSVKVYPERFFDIIYQNTDIFKDDSEVNVNFLPNVNFKLLFNCDDISENTKKTIWKYLQLILFTVVGGVKDKTNFGDTMNLFDGINEGDLQEKLKETMTGLTDFFKNVESKMDSENTNEEFKNMFENMPNAEGFKNPFEKMGGMPDVENLQDHLKSLFDGKIGSLAKEMAEEISGEFTDLIGEDMNDVTNTQDVIKKLMKNPKKIMDLMKTVSGKLDSKMKSGEISREELMKEAGDLMGKMKDMGGQDQFNEMFKNMAKSMGGMGKNMKLDTNALDRMTKQASTRDRIRAKMQDRKQKQIDELEKQNEQYKKQLELQQSMMAKYSLESTDTNKFVFRLDGEEAQEKSFITNDFIADLQSGVATNAVQGDKKKKKKKTKK